MNPHAALPDPTTPRWQPLRAGIQGLWHYDDQRFVFHRGRLLLRGRNESGKSKALELLLPFLLDADLAPQRLDPFGSTSRQMRWNLLGDANPDVNTAIGYTWLELGRRGPEGPETCTIGAGLRARRSRNDVESWFFVTDLRPDADLALLDASRVPLSPGRLAEVLGDRGRLLRTRADYRAQVNERLFGMPTDQYDALVEALLELRRPQLSKQLDPAELSRILSVSLPPLDGGVIGRLAEGFERLERHRSQRDEAARARDALVTFLGTYRAYVEAVARGRAGAVTAAEAALQGARAAWRQAQEAAEAALARRDELDARRADLQRQRLDLDTRLAALEASEAWRGVQELHQLEQQAQDLARAAARADERAQAADRELSRREAAAVTARGQQASARQALDEARQLALDAAARADLDAAHAAVDRTLETADPAAVRGQVSSLERERRAALAELRALAAALTRAEGEHRRAVDRLALAEEAREQARAHHGQALAQDRQAEADWRQALREWAERSTVLDLGAVDLDATPADGIPGRVRAAATAARRGLDDEVGATTATRREVARALREVQRERQALAAASHQPPPAAHWRDRPRDRPGAPLYLLCEFTDALAPAEQARVEAALESAGLLDAWVCPDGRLLDASDSAILADNPAPGRTLADILRPTPAGGVPAPVIRRALAAIGLGESDAHAWVDTGGRWRLGPLAGRWTRDQVSYVGATAREAARQRRLAELSGAAAELEDRLAAVDGALSALLARRAALDEALAALPDLAPLHRARATLQASAQALARAEPTVEERGAATRTTRASLDQAVQSRADRARARGLLAWVDDLDTLADRTRDWGAATARALRDRQDLAAAAEQLARAHDDRERAATAAEAARQEADEATQRAREGRVRLDAMREALGSDPEAVLHQMREGEARLRDTLRALADTERDARQAERLVGETAAAASATGSEADRREQDRAEAADHLRDLARTGVLLVIGAPAAELGSWTQVLDLARDLARRTCQADASAQARERAENRVVDKHRDRLVDLGAVVQVRPVRDRGVLVYRGTFGSREGDLSALAQALDEDVAARDRLLSQREQALFETFLSGETHAHLRERLREAHALVDDMNAQLGGRPTAGGTRLHLDWSLTEDAPAGTAQAIALLLRSSALLSGADRDALGRFLRQRLDEAHGALDLGSLRDKLLAVLDYRSWYRFTIQVQEHGQGGWRKLTRKVHAAGSGGQKAVLLHLPLFAAAAAFYRSARPDSPRLVVLDEAFAGIDRAMRGQLMGMLAAFELDFLMTSYEEWGFYEELDGLATYQLSRERDVPGVFTDRFVWEGGVVHELGLA